MAAFAVSFVNTLEAPVYDTLLVARHSILTKARIASRLYLSTRALNWVFKSYGFRCLMKVMVRSVLSQCYEFGLKRLCKFSEKRQKEHFRRFRHFVEVLGSLKEQKMRGVIKREGIHALVRVLKTHLVSSGFEALDQNRYRMGNVKRTM
jgi:hypothetical protein